MDTSGHDGSGRRTDQRRPRLQPRFTVGTLLAHGRANYLFDREQDVSYYVKLRTDHGTRYIWGRDLERAFAESVTKPQRGDQIGVRRKGLEPVTLPAPPGGPASQGATRLAYRSLWEVESAQHFASRFAEARRRRDALIDARNEAAHSPELRGTFLTLRALELVAEKRLPDPKQRAAFLRFAKEAMTTSITPYSKIPTPKMRTPVSARTNLSSLALPDPPPSTAATSQESKPPDREQGTDAAPSQERTR